MKYISTMRMEDLVISPNNFPNCSTYCDVRTAQEIIICSLSGAQLGEKFTCTKICSHLHILTER